MDIAKDDGRLHTAGAITLHPSVGRENKSLQPFPEVFHHVIAFEFPMHKDIDTELFLEADTLGRLFFQEGGVIGFGEFPLLEAGTGVADIGGLREGTDRGGREERKTQSPMLLELSFREGRPPGAVRRADGSGTRLDQGAVNSATASARLISGEVLFKRRCIRHRCAQTRQDHDLGKLLLGKGEP